jgi:hypothetical protein
MEEPSNKLSIKRQAQILKKSGVDTDRFSATLIRLTFADLLKVLMGRSQNWIPGIAQML